MQSLNPSGIQTLKNQMVPVYNEGMASTDEWDVYKADEKIKRVIKAIERENPKISSSPKIDCVVRTSAEERADKVIHHNVAIVMGVLGAVFMGVGAALFYLAIVILTGGGAAIGAGVAAAFISIVGLLSEVQAKRMFVEYFFRLGSKDNPQYNKDYAELVKWEKNLSEEESTLRQNARRGYNNTKNRLNSHEIAMRNARHDVGVACDKDPQDPKRHLSIDMGIDLSNPYIKAALAEVRE